MAEPYPNPPPNATETEPASEPIVNGTPIPTVAPAPTDVEMVDSTLIVQTPTHNQQQPPPPQSAPAVTPVHTAVQTPTRNSPHPSAHSGAPSHPNPHGSSTRVYLNQNVTPHLLEAMKHLATTEPDKPLKWLSEFLAQKSREIEGL